MKVEVTQKHIEASLNSDKTEDIYHTCPLALALTEAFAEPCWVGMFNWGKVSSPAFYMQPTEMSRFRQHFDNANYELAKPFVFEI